MPASETLKSLSNIPPGTAYNWLGLAAAAHRAALRRGTASLDRRNGLALVALHSWRRFRQRDSVGLFDETVLSELLMRSELLRRFGDSGPNELSAERFWDRFVQAIGETDEQTLRDDVKGVQKDLRAVPIEKLQRLRRVKNLLRSVSLYLDSFSEIPRFRSRWRLGGTSAAQTSLEHVPARGFARP